MRPASLLALSTLIGFIAACGQKGPLVLPDAQHPHKKIGVPKPPAPSPPQTQPPTGNGTPASGTAPQQ